MPLYSKKHLEEVGRNFSKELHDSFILENKSLSTHFDIFIAHSYLDNIEVKGLYNELSKKGFRVYVDWIIDAHLDRNYVTKESASLIRERLRSSKTLLLAISENEQISKWTPWELGYMDGHTHKCAIAPISANITPSKAYKGKEYLSLYPYIKLADFDNTTDLYLVESAQRYINYKEWIKSNNTISNKLQNIDFL